jgi:hypothetical protein
VNKRQALSEGLSFTGTYEKTHKKELVKTEAARIRKLGFKAVIVEVDGGVSVYASKEYFAARQAYETYQLAKHKVTNIPVSIQKFKDEIAKLEEELAKANIIVAGDEPRYVGR